MLGLFSDNLSDLYFADHQISMMPLDALIEHPTCFDAQMFRSIIHEDDAGMGGVINILDDFYPDLSKPRNIQRTIRSALGLDADYRRLARIIYYSFFDRKTLKDKLYAKAYPVAMVARYPYRLVRGVRNFIRIMPEKIKRHL